MAYERSSRLWSVEDTVKSTTKQTDNMGLAPMEIKFPKERAKEKESRKAKEKAIGQTLGIGLVPGSREEDSKKGSRMTKEKVRAKASPKERTKANQKGKLNVPGVWGLRPLGQ